MTKRKFIGFAAAVLVIHLFFILIYGAQKEAFHEDEYYSYSTSTGHDVPNPYGPIQEKSGMDLQSNFYVTNENRFDFASVIDIHKTDVHPPLYYLTLHFIMSLFPYSFYKWFGILLNACYSLISCGGIIYFIYRMDQSRHRYFLSLLSGLLYAIHPAFISNAMFTRMYCMSVMWTVLYINVFVLLMQNIGNSRKRFTAITLGGAVICYFAFLTHYFCLYIPFFLTLGFCIYALIRQLFYKEKCILRMLIYGISMVAAIGLAFLTFPSSISQILSEEQGEGAFATLLETDMFTMLKLFLPVLNKNFFAGMLYPVLGLLGIASLTGALLIIKRKRHGAPMPQTNLAILGIGLTAGMVAVWITSKTSLYLGDASSRYFYPAAALVLPLIAYTICKVILTSVEFYRCLIIVPAREADKPASFRDHKQILQPETNFPGRYAQTLLSLILAIVILIPAVAGHLQENVLFLYRDKAETIQYARDNAQYPLVMIYDQSARFKTWYIANETWPYERVIFIRYDEEATVIENEALKTAEKLIVYMDSPEEILDRLVAQNDHLTSWSLLRHDFHYFVYVLE